MPKKISVVWGAPCSGKSTYVREAIGDKDIVYDYDRILSAITYKESHNANKHPAHEYVLGFRLSILNRLKGQDELEHAYIITRYPTEALKKQLESLDPEYVEIKADKQTCYDRLEQDDSRPDKEEWRGIIDEWFRSYGDRENEERRRLMQARSERVERRFAFETRAVERQEGEELWVEGYAVRFDSPTVLFELDGVEYREQVAAGAFDGARMDDVIFNYNHSGKVVARTRNNTLQLEVDGKGLKTRARLDGTEEGRRLYDEISKGYIDRMSFQFTIEEEEFDRAQRLWTVNKVKRLYDVSAVDIPAYDDTSIQARKAAALEADAQQRQQAAQAALARQRVELALKLS